MIPVMSPIKRRNLLQNEVQITKTESKIEYTP
jgi:hypothetical protein